MKLLIYIHLLSILFIFSCKNKIVISNRQHSYNVKSQSIHNIDPISTTNNLFILDTVKPNKLNPKKESERIGYQSYATIEKSKNMMFNKIHQYIKHHNPSILNLPPPTKKEIIKRSDKDYTALILILLLICFWGLAILIYSGSFAINIASIIPSLQIIGILLVASIFGLTIYYALKLLFKNMLN